MCDAVAQFVDGFELQVELRPVGSGRPCGVQIRYPKVALAASVCHVGPEAEHEPCNHLIGVCRVVRPPTGIVDGAAIYHVHVAQFSRLAISQDGACHGRVCIEEPVFVTIEALGES